MYRYLDSHEGVSGKRRTDALSILHQEHMARIITFTAYNAENESTFTDLGSYSRNANCFTGTGLRAHLQELGPLGRQQVVGERTAFWFLDLIHSGEILQRGHEVRQIPWTGFRYLGSYSINWLPIQVQHQLHHGERKNPKLGTRTSRR